MDVQNLLSWCYLSKQGHWVSPINRGGATELNKHCIRVFPRFVCGKEGEGVVAWCALVCGVLLHDWADGDYVDILVW